ncbi:predicted protein [Aspergillus nidulans FGSC A4]|uniref:Uncharacterized protein n=1 Tax=Emericella nidulans (strain FGSC A4 / ATCC 38163 / CBS 112.46 / NRRL 194 / M139) TaxID=227321 RepID=Q5B813_EMENI|nr:hypothetical protein [Aspergillus nidulans FGSC A4]EAA63285.1 predicted protein [Aspergillus nidulans FGSC A4]CBF82967.1 TPA: conserved hypothetical protein [Aspergillus nidulans FGSC A4]|eukprot:XP_660921.1 predicted protein [Aspergillus nidulans FGSC A4]
MAWNKLEGGLRVHIPDPAPRTIIAEFLDQLDAKYGIWKDMTRDRGHIGQIKRATKRPASPISKHGPPGRLLLDLYIHMHRTKLPRDLSATKLALNDIPAKQFYKRGKESLLPTVNMVSEARQKCDEFEM